MVRVFLEDIYNEFSLSKSSFNHIFLGISEAVCNAILHGNKLDSNKRVFIRLNVFGNQMHIEVEDEGDGFSESVLFDPTIPENIKCEHGRGLFILKNLADTMVFQDGGRKVSILFTIPQ